ncbi:MAG: immunoglobulin domain-containing protein, partial [Limisphaerales bacterium]
MKPLLVAFLALFAGASSAPAQTILAQWNFNGQTVTNAPTPSFGAGTASLAGGTTGAYASGAGSSDPAPDNDSAWNLSGFPPDGTAPKTAGAQFAVSTAGYQDILLQFDFRASSTASRRVQVQAAADGLNFTDIAAFTITEAAVFTNELTFNLASLPAFDNQAAFAMRVVSDFASGTNYLGVSNDYGTGGTWRLDMVTVSGTTTGAPQPPSIVTPPQSQTVGPGSTVTLGVVASGSPTLAYQWQLDGAPIGGATGKNLTLTNVSGSSAGGYRVVVSNPVNTITSAVATLTVPASIATNIAHLRTLVDPVNLIPTNNAQLYSVVGVVTTWINLTTTNSGLFYFQDGAAGLAVFHSGATNIVPPAGSRVRVTAPLTHFNGLLQLSPSKANTQHEVTILSAENALPAAGLTSPSELNTLLPAVVDQLWEGRLVVFTNVSFTVPGSFTNSTSGANETVTDGDENFTLRVDGRTDLLAQTKPVGATRILGVLSQFDTSNPRNTGWQLLPSRFAELVQPVDPPAIDVDISTPDLGATAQLSYTTGNTFQYQVRSTTNLVTWTDETDWTT